MKKKIVSNLEQWDFIGYRYADIEKQLNKYAPCIGLFLISFSYLEHELNLTISDILNDRSHELGYVVIERLTFSNKIELFYKISLRITTLKNKAEKHRLDKIRNRLKVINKLRNNIVHANWQTLDKKFVRTKIFTDSEEGFIKFEKIHITLKAISDATAELIKLTNEMEEYKERLLQFEP